MNDCKMNIKTLSIYFLTFRIIIDRTCNSLVIYFVICSEDFKRQKTRWFHFTFEMEHSLSNNMSCIIHHIHPLSLFTFRLSDFPSFT